MNTPRSDRSLDIDWRALAPFPRFRLVVMIAAHDEEQSIGATLDSVLAQTRRPDLTVVAADNCSDATGVIAKAKQFSVLSPILVNSTIANSHKKSGALNQAWELTRRYGDLFICIDADTVLPPNALADWEAEFRADEHLAGCSAKFTMLSSQEMAELAVDGVVPPSAAELPEMDFRERMWCRMQKSEFSRWTDTALARKGRWTSVLAGTACAIRASALEQVVAQRAARGELPLPWSYESEVEDFELTYRIRELGYECRVSDTVRAYTGAMLTLKTLWAQRLKWQVGTVRTLKAIGINRLTLIDWWQQFVGLLAAVTRVAWVLLLVFGVVVAGQVHVLHYWWVFPLAFVTMDLREAVRIPHRTPSDILTAVLLLPQEIFAWVRAAWFTWSWFEVLSGRSRDRWALQIAAERG